MSSDEQTAGDKAARAEQRPSSVLELVGSDSAMSTVLSFLGPTMEDIDSEDKGQFSGGRLREALALGRVLPGVCVAMPIKVGPAGAALLAADACLGGLVLAEGSSLPLVFDALKLNTGLRKLYLRMHRCALNAGDVTLLCGALAVNVSLVDVDFLWIPLDRPGAHAMATVLSTTTSLQKLNLGFCQLEPGDVAVLAGALAANAALRELNIRGNIVGEAGGRALAAALETNSTLHVLRMSSNHLGDVGGCAIGVALATNTGLFQLDLCRNGLGEASGRAMAAALATNTTLRELDLSSNMDFGRSGAVALFGALRSNRTLLELGLKETGLGHASGVALADMVRENSTLRVLNLTYNWLGRARDGSAGSSSWAQVLAALKDNIGLHTLYLRACGLSADDGQALAQALEQRPSGLLRKLGGLSHNSDIGDGSNGAIIAACLKPGASVASLDGVLQRNAGQETMRFLAQGLRHANRLEVLDLRNINFGAEGSWTELFAALAVNTRVCTLLLGDCDLTAADGQALASALQQRPPGVLRELEVRNNSKLGVGDDACSAIIVACLRPGSALRKLNIGASSAGLAATLSLAGCLRANHTLEELRLGGMGAEGNWSELFGALAVNSGLCSLSLTDCGLKQHDVEALAAALRTNHALQDLCVIDGALGNECAKIMAGGLATNTTLRRLVLYSCSSSLDAAAHAFCMLLQTNFTLRVLQLRHASPASPAYNAAIKTLEQAGRAKGCRIAFVNFRLLPF